MTTWEFNDGTIVTSGGFVEGDSPFAANLTSYIEACDTGSPPPVFVAPPPAGDIALDPRDNWLLNRWLGQEMEWWNRVQGAKLKIKTTYSPTTKDIPPDVSRLIAASAPAPDDPPDAVY